MKIYKAKETTETTQVVSEVFCDRCGDQCRDPSDHNDTSIQVKATGCFDSDFPPDTTIWTFDLCQFCYAALIAELKNPPVTQEYLLTGRGDILPDEDDGLLLLLTCADPSLLLQKLRTSDVQRFKKLTQRVMEKIRLEPRPLVRAAWEEISVEEIFDSKGPQAHTDDDRLFSLWFSYCGDGVYIYTVEQRNGALLEDAEGTREAYTLLLNEFPHADGAELKQKIEGKPRHKNMLYVPIRTWEFQRVDPKMIEAEALSKKADELYSQTVIMNDHAPRGVRVKP